MRKFEIVLEKANDGVWESGFSISGGVKLCSSGLQRRIEIPKHVKELICVITSKPLSEDSFHIEIERSSGPYWFSSRIKYQVKSGRWYTVAAYGSTKDYLLWRLQGNKECYVTFQYEE